MATGHIQPGYGTPVTRLRRAQTAYPLDKSKIREMAQQNVGLLERRTLEDIRKNARNMWMSSNYSPTTYNSTHSYLQLDEATPSRPTSPSRRHKPHPKPVFLINRLHFVPGYHNPDATMGKDVYRIDDSFPEEERQLRRHQREKYKALPTSSAVDQYTNPWAPLTESIGPVEAWGAQGWLKTADDNHQHEVVNAIRDFRDQDLIDPSRFDYNVKRTSDNSNGKRFICNTDTKETEENEHRDGHTERRENGIAFEYQGEQLMEKKSSQGEQPNNENEANENGGGPFDQMDKAAEYNRDKFDHEKTDLEKTVADKWKAWQAEYKQGIQKRIKENTWQNKITGVRREMSAKGEINKLKYSHTSTGSTAGNGIKDGQSVAKKKSKNASTNQVNNNPSKGKGLINLRPSSAKCNSHTNKCVGRNDNNTITNKDLFKQVLISTRQKEGTTSLKVRPKSAASLRSVDKMGNKLQEKERKGQNINKQSLDTTKPVAQMLTEKKPLENQLPQSENTQPKEGCENQLSEAEIMRQIIDRQLMENESTGDWLHWVYDDNEAMTSPMTSQAPIQPGSVVRPFTAYPSNHRWMKQAGVRESEEVRRIRYGGYPPSTIQPLGSLGNPATILERKQQDIDNVKRHSYVHKPSRGDFLIHPEYPPTFPHHRID